MRKLVHPDQAVLCDLDQQQLSPQAARRLLAGWPHLFRTALLKLMPAPQLARHFHPSLGRPTKELYAIAGLLLIKEFLNLTVAQAVEAFLFRKDVQYALNVPSAQAELSERTLQRYEQLFRVDALARKVMDDVTRELVRLLELDVRDARLDSTHLTGDSRKLGRTALIKTVIRRMLACLETHSPDDYGELPEEFRRRHPTPGHPAAEGWSDPEQGEPAASDSPRRTEPTPTPTPNPNPKPSRAALQQAVEDLTFFADWLRRSKTLKRSQEIPKSRVYQDLMRVEGEQCQVDSNGVASPKEKPGGRILVSPSDHDATLDGHKGAGYQVQLVETCGESNEVQLILAAEPQTAVESDSEALQPMVDRLRKQKYSVERLLADTSYGSDENVGYCEARGIELISPAGGTKNLKGRKRPEGRVTLGDFELEPSTNVCTACPRGCKPRVSYDRRYYPTTMVIMTETDCQTCELRKECPIKSDWGLFFSLTIPQRDWRLSHRRRLERRPEFRDRYRKRSGIEATISLAKRVTGLGRLRVRGSKAVFNGVLLRVAGWNILRASRSRKVYEKLPKELLRASLLANRQTGSSGRLQGRLWVRWSPGIDRWVQSTDLHWKAA